MSGNKYSEAIRKIYGSVNWGVSSRSENGIAVAELVVQGVQETVTWPAATNDEATAMMYAWILARAEVLE